MTTHPGILLNPHAYDPQELDAESRELMEATIAYFESLGKDRITSDDNEGVWYDDFCRFLGETAAQIASHLAVLDDEEDHGAGPRNGSILFRLQRFAARSDSS